MAKVWAEAYAKLWALLKHFQNVVVLQPRRIWMPYFVFFLIVRDKTRHFCPIITSPPVAGHRVEPPIVTCHALVTYLVTLPRHP